MTAYPIVRATAAQADAFAYLHAQCFADAWSGTVFQDLLVSPNVVGLLFISASGETLGFALGRVAADEAEVLSIGVLPTIRGQGIGKNLLTELLAHLKAAGAAHVFLEVGANNAPAQVLYAALGFRPAGVRKGYYLSSGQPEDAAILRLDFGAP